MMSDAWITRAELSGRLRRAVYRMRAPWVLLECGLAGIALAVAALWLAIPDEGALGRAASVLLGLAGVGAGAWAQSYVLTLVRRRTTRVPAWRGALLLLGLGLDYWLVATFFDAGRVQDVTRAHTWVDTTWVWHVASYRTLIRLQSAMWWLLRWLLAAVLLPFAMEGAATGMRGRWFRRAASVLRKPLFFAVLLLSAALGTFVTTGLMAFRPAWPEFAEMLLAVAKVVTIFAVDMAALCMTLSLTGTYLRDAEAAMPARPAEHPSSGRRRRRSSAMVP